MILAFLSLRDVNYFLYPWNTEKFLIGAPKAPLPEEGTVAVSSHFQSSHLEQLSRKQASENRRKKER